MKLKLTLVATVLVGAVLMPQAAMADRYCATYRDGSYRVVVSASHVSCRKAKRVAKSFRVTKSRGWKHRGGSTSADSYWVNRKFKGWKCSEGSGGGACRRGNSWASWQVN
jgi:hypothetical protein